MPKINQAYTSPWEWLSKKIPIFEDLDRTLHPYVDMRVKYGFDRRFDRQKYKYNGHIRPWRQVIGSLQPLADIWKDFIDVFRPYKATYHFWRDLKQPFIGLYHILEGVVELFFSLIIAIPTLIQAIINTPLLLKTIITFLRKKVKDNYGKEEADLLPLLPSKLQNLAWCEHLKTYDDKKIDLLPGILQHLAWLIGGFSNVIRGITQVLITPLTYSIKIPLRALIITPIKGKPKIESNAGLQQRVKIVEEHINSNSHTSKDERNQVLDLICDIHRKYEKSLQHKEQKTDIDQEKERQAFEDLIESDYPNEVNNEYGLSLCKQVISNFISLFQLKTTESAQRVENKQTTDDRPPEKNDYASKT